MRVSSSPKWISSIVNGILVSKADDLNNNKEVEEVEEKNSQKIDSYNTTSKLYFELSEDMRKYATANPTQDKIDEDVMSILSKYEDSDGTGFFNFHTQFKVAFVAQSEEGKKLALEMSEKMKKVTDIMVSANKESRELIEKYGYELHGEVSALTSYDFTKDEFENKINFLYDRFGKEIADSAINDIKNFKTKFDNLFATLKPKDFKENFTLVGEDYAHYNLGNEEDMTKFAEEDRKNFQNTYRLSDEFAKTEKFVELYKEYKAEDKRLAEEARKKGKYFAWDYIFNNDFLEVEKSMVIKKGYSKSEWIESINKSKTTLENIIKDNPNMMDSVKVDMKDNIKFYENILTDLKELWHYGDFKVDG